MQFTQLTWTIGNVKIFQLVELEAGEIIQSVIPDATPENIKKIDWMMPNFADNEGNLKALVQCFLICSNGKNILIDTCNGNDKPRVDVLEWNNLKTNFLEKLESTGINRERIDYVACTHLHMDHVGWNTILKGTQWVPTFPNARYIFDKKEFEYWNSKPEKEIVDDHSAFVDSVLPILSAGLAEFVEPYHKIDSNISFIPTPGHTPSHISVLVESEGQQAIISGDLMHHPCQIAFPQWGTIADTFPEIALESRKKIIDKIANTKTLLIGSHFANPVAGRVSVDVNGIYKFEI